MIKFTCGSCGHKMGAPEKYAGKKVKCKKCGQITRIPEAQKAPETPKAPEAHAEENIIKFRCPSCNQKIGVKAKYAGKKVRCAKCRRPLIIPSPSVLQAPPDRQEAAAVLKTGPEEQFDEGFPDLSSDFNKLLDIESSAPPVETEQPLTLAPAEEQTVSDYPLDETKFMGTQAIKPPKKKKTGLYIALGAVAFIIILGLVLYLTMPERPQQPRIGETETRQAQTFASDYIDLLIQNDIEKAASLLSPELQNSIQQDELESFAQRIAKGPIRDIIPSTPYVESQDYRTLFYMHFNIYYGEQNEQIDFRNQDSEFDWQDLQFDFQNLVLVVSKTDLDMRVEELALQNPMTYSAVSLGPTPYEQLSEIALTTEMEELGFLANIFGRFFCGIMIALIILGLLNIISIWIVFDKAGEPGWAVIVPFYNMWVYAKVADQSGWLGLSTCFVGMIPYVGWLIGIVIHIYLAIGIAKNFDRGVLFGIGLCFLPFIFFPILAFSD